MKKYINSIDGDGNSIGSPILVEHEDIIFEAHVDASGTTAGGAKPIPDGGSQVAHVVAICNRVDASNYAVRLDNVPPGGVCEIYAQNGNITVFPSSGGGTFIDGSSSVVVSSGAIFRHTNSSAGWGYVKGA